MGDTILEVDGATLSSFAGGLANFSSYRGRAYQIDDERGRFAALTPAQALRFAIAILDDQYPHRAKLTEDDTSEAAFPMDRDGINGMTLRDYFAARIITNVLPGLLSDQCTVKEATNTAYEVADAMLVARKAVRS